MRYIRMHHRVRDICVAIDIDRNNKASLPYKRKTGQIRLVNIFSQYDEPEVEVIFSDITSIFCIRCDL